MSKRNSYATFYALLGTMPGASKEELVLQWTGGRTESLREMTDDEYNAMIRDLRRQVECLDDKRKARSAVLRQFQLYGIDTTDWDAVDRFCASPRIAGKAFRHLTIAELKTLRGSYQRSDAKLRQLTHSITNLINRSMEDVRTVQMTDAEWQEYQSLKREQEERDKAQKRKADREAYRRLSEEAVSEVFVEIKRLNEQMQATKKMVMERFLAILKMRDEAFDTDSKQSQYSFVDEGVTQRIIIGRYKKYMHDTTAEAGIEMVKAYLETLGTDSETQKLVRIILDLLSENAQGELEPDKILQLDRYAEEFGSEEFAEGVKIIKESLIFDWTKYFFRAEEKNADGAWKSIPLSMINVN